MSVKPHVDWIKVDRFDSTTMPEEGILVWVFDGEISTATLGSWYLGRFDNWRGEGMRGVTHWAPLVVPNEPYVP